jgi:hypothetical protein
MGMRFFWVAGAVEQGKFDVKYYPGKENLGNYQSQHQIGAHHKVVRPWYLHKLTSVHEFPRASKSSTLKGCVGTLTDMDIYVPAHYLKFPLSRVSQQVGNAYLLTSESHN